MKANGMQSPFSISAATWMVIFFALCAPPTRAATDDDGFILFEPEAEPGAANDADADADGGTADSDGEALFDLDDGGADGGAVEDAEEGGFDDEGSETLVSGRRGARKRIAGSATYIGEAELEKMEYDDVQRSLKQKVPGVYVREEDGFGLRPNIGLRGANSDRSAKITLLEDNVLFGPAPYAAPAAYYFPLASRMTGIEVFKGPAALRTGPNTVGGAVNLRTRRIPWSGVSGGVDVAGGMYESGKGHAYLGAGNDHFGILIEGLHLRSGGFKRIDGGPGNGLWGNDTGFSRNDVMVKARANTDPNRAWMHAMEVKLGFANESSNETYLGLTDEDFAKDPNRRYFASSRGQMEWNRTQAQARYRFTWGDDVDASVTVYRHDMQRAWEKFNRFANGPSVRTVLQNSSVGQNELYYQLLTGTRDSLDANDALMIGTNDRRYYSQGIQGRARVGFDLWKIRQDVEVGLRLHQDQIMRDHTESAFLVQGRQLVRADRDELVTADNTDSATALSGYLVDEIGFGPLLLAPGLRVEVVRSTRDDRLVDGPLSDETRISLIPGVGAYVQALPILGFFGGVHKGFAPVAPGQPADVMPEESWNYELGARLDWMKTRGEVTAYVNHYTNLTGNCTFSSGCDDSALGAQFNAGEAIVGGGEVVFGQDIPLPLDIELNVDVVYTLTIARFLTDFSSGFPQWGDVEAGDELPYVPTHQGAVTTGLTRGPLTWTVSLSYVGTMLDEAAQGDVDSVLIIPPTVFVDSLVSYDLGGFGDLYFRVDNLLNAKTIASRRPFGARPGKPLLAMVGYRHRF